MHNSDPPAGLNTKDLDRLLALAGNEAKLGRRIDLISAGLLGRPYIQNPLGGGPHMAEAFTASLDAFDCVTFIETVLAIALSSNAEEFARTLRLLRYHNGEVAWPRRNHYMLDWSRRNQKAGFVKNTTRGKHVVIKKRTLSLVPGLGPKHVSFACYPKREIGSVKDRIRTGDFILFASVKKRLDVFHAGLIVVSDSDLLLRHATRTRGAVIEQPLNGFLSSNRMAGFIVLRPLDPALD
ncbi:MAG TPA: N-acetylmuramoyl-L-alanine amidase-like domain-containing protein [Blastocatellia bacterium]|nr:N-acetylmuramoyl-L-alanine amidase-like domain-containing protein [Blastocatellia bacterium]